MSETIPAGTYWPLGPMSEATRIDTVEQGAVEIPAGQFAFVSYDEHGRYVRAFALHGSTHAGSQTARAVP